MRMILVSVTLLRHFTVINEKVDERGRALWDLMRGEGGLHCDELQEDLKVIASPELPSVKLMICDFSSRVADSHDRDVDVKRACICCPPSCPIIRRFSLSPVTPAGPRPLIVRGRVVAVLKVLVIFKIVRRQLRELKYMVSNRFICDNGDLISGSTGQHGRIVQITRMLRRCCKESSVPAQAVLQLRAPAMSVNRIG